MIHKGDRVIYKSDPRKLRGTVVDTEYSGWLHSTTRAMVEFDDPNLIPRRMWISMVELELLTEFRPFKASEMDGCNCGLKFCREGGKHSEWCNLYRKGN